MQYIVKVELLSDGLFGSGNSVAGLVDMDILYNRDGFPYMKGKTFKGKLREEVNQILYCINKGKSDLEQLYEMFGCEDGNQRETLKFSDLEISPQIQEVIHNVIVDSNNDIRKEDIVEAYTEIRNFTSIDEVTGTAKKGSLRKARVIKKGVIFYSTITSEKELSEKQENILAASVRSLKHLGTMETRGKGYVKCSLIKEGTDITERGIRNLLLEED